MAAKLGRADICPVLALAGLGGKQPLQFVPAAASAGSGRNFVPLQLLRKDTVQHVISEGF